MVRLKGPGLASEAAGGLGEVISFSQSKGRAYAKKWSKPKNLKTPPQLGMRAMMRFLSEEWDGLGSGAHNAWIPLAAATNVSPFNAYQSRNLERWRDGLGPTVDDTYDLTTPLGASDWPLATAVSRGVRFTGTVTGVLYAWGTGFHSQTAPGQTPSWATLIHAQNIRTLGPFTWIWRPLAPGTYYIRITRFGLWGAYEVRAPDYTVIVT